MQTFYLEPDQVPQHLRGSYTGRKFKVQLRTEVTIPAQAGVWGGGSRDTYRAIRLSDGATLPASDQMSAPWSNARADHKIELRDGFALVEHSIFCGKDMGLTFYVHPSNAQALLPAPAADLSAVQAKVLNIIAGTKSSYRDDARSRASISPADYAQAKADLTELGMLNRAGAVTVKGRNVRQGGAS